MYIYRSWRHALRSEWPFIIIIIYRWLTSIDEGCTHQGSWGQVGDVAGTAMSKTQVAVQSRGPGNTHREGTYLQLGSPAICVMRVAVCLHMQTNGLLYLNIAKPFADAVNVGM